jgi:hypothetical protein
VSIGAEPYEGVGVHDSFDSAAEAAHEKLAQPIVEVDSLAKWRGNPLIVMYDKSEKLWSIITGKGNKFIDTKVRFKTQEEARRAVGNQ